MSEVTLPAGMKAWAGGDSAPEDWDGGPVLWHDGVLTGAHRTSFGWLRDLRHRIIAYTPRLKPTLPPSTDAPRTFALGERVEKISGSSWHGHVVGFYSTALTPDGVAVESERETGSVQVYPAKALRAASTPPPSTDVLLELANATDDGRAG